MDDFDATEETSGSLACDGFASAISGFLPPLAGFFKTIPQPVLGGCTIMMFGQILVSGMQMIHRAGFNDRNFTIAALALCIGGGFTAVVLNLLLPKEKNA